MLILPKRRYAHETRYVSMFSFTARSLSNFTFLWINDPVIMLDFMNMHNNYSDKTIECREFYLHSFNQYIVQNKLSFNDMSVDVIEEYFRFMGYELSNRHNSANHLNLFFQLISRRYEKKSTIITSNKNMSKWSELFKDPMITNAILDRLLHHSKVIQMIGPSYRTKDLILADKESEEQSQNW